MKHAANYLWNTRRGRLITAAILFILPLPGSAVAAAAIFASARKMAVAVVVAG